MSHLLLLIPKQIFEHVQVACALRRLSLQIQTDFKLTICKAEFASHMHIKEYIKSKLVRVQLGAVGT